jgi:hypothetical protein
VGDLYFGVEVVRVVICLFGLWVVFWIIWFILVVWFLLMGVIWIRGDFDWSGFFGIF